MEMKIKKIIFYFVSLFLFLLISINLFSQDDLIALRGGKLITVTGSDIKNGILLIKNGKILNLGENINIPQGAEIIDIPNYIVIPGPIDSFTHLGVTDIFPSNQDFDEKTNPITPHLRVIDGLNPGNKFISIVRKFGVTTALVAPGETNLLSGQSALIHLSGETIDEMLIKFPVGIHANTGELPKLFYGKKGMMPSTRMGEVALLRQTLIDAMDYFSKLNREQKEIKGGLKFKEPSTLEMDFILNSLVPVIKKELPLIIRANRKDDILTALRIAKEFNLKIIINHGAESYKVAKDLSAKNIPVLVGPESSYFKRIETLDSTFDNVVHLWKAGVKFSFQSSSSHEISNIFYQAQLGIKYGLPYREAIKALTIYPAQIFGVDDRLGSLEKGKIANLVVFDGDPLDINSKIKLIIINGKIIENELY